MYACAVEILPPVIPSRILPRNNIQIVVANPSIRKPIPVPIIDRKRTGLRPCLSESRPRIGEKISCMIEYDAKRNPTVRGVALKAVPSA
jgi:hypothetical protein